MIKKELFLVIPNAAEGTNSKFKSSQPKSFNFQNILDMLLEKRLSGIAEPFDKLPSTSSGQAGQVKKYIMLFGKFQI
jgi:hypothetical protein